MKEYYVVFFTYSLLKPFIPVCNRFDPKLLDNQKRGKYKLFETYDSAKEHIALIHEGGTAEYYNIVKVFTRP